MSDVDVNDALAKALDRRWTRPDGRVNVGGNGFLAWDTSRVQLRLVTPPEYEDLRGRLAHGSKVLQEEVIRNDTDAELQETFSYSTDTADRYEWHVEAGLKVAAGAKAKVDIPLIGEGEASASVELQFGGGYKASHSETVKWQSTRNITVPAHTSLVVKATLSTGKVSNVPFVAHVYAFGQVGFEYWRGTDVKDWMWADLDAGGWMDPGFNPLKKLPLAEEDRHFTASGVFSGSVGFSSTVSLTPLPT